jgi:hypothetical protein
MSGPLVVAVDVQHQFKPAPFAGDRGARFAFRSLSSGATLHVNESELAHGYADGLASTLELGGARVLRNDPARALLIGHYWQRHRQALALGARVFLACHVNAGGGRYAQVGYSSSAPPGVLEHSIGLATRIAAELQGLPRVSGAQVRRLELVHGSATIRTGARLGLVALLLEPFFGDSPGHQTQFFPPAGLASVGEAIGRAVLEWNGASS